MPSEFAEGMPDAEPDRTGDVGCVFVIDSGGVGSRRISFCAAERQPGSPYCPLHHAQCRLPGGSTAEKQQLREIEALAAAVGGRQGRATRQPPPRLLRRLDRVARTASCPDRSCIVPEN
ncbi:MAG TPA: hypothetical protein VGQ90_05650 [Stellaceae bacterium]|nr:hypothetical protein [Stellaceae bacterium]